MKTDRKILEQAILEILAPKPGETRGQMNEVSLIWGAASHLCARYRPPAHQGIVARIFWAPTAILNYVKTHKLFLDIQKDGVTLGKMQRMGLIDYYRKTDPGDGSTISYYYITDDGFRRVMQSRQSRAQTPHAG
ncbi:MAG: hypothetical protein KGI37_06270 [Alphaproteobacteria bacterium]|nr:hypothetical protein [Alphaproteobacteria bacterium]